MAAQKVDKHGLKVGQALTILLLLIAFVLDSWVLVVLVAIAQLLGGLDAPFAPYRLIYQQLISYTNWIAPKVVADNPEPHRFAMLVGAIVNGLGALAMLAGIPLLGWALVWVVIFLANLNFWLNFCLGCWMYYQFHRIGIRGFTRGPIQ